MPTDSNFFFVHMARSNTSFQKARFRIIKRLSNRPQDGLGKLTEHLSKKLLQIRKGWKALDFKDQDWVILEQLESSSEDLKNVIIDNALDYVRHNIGRVTRLREVSDAFSNALLTGNTSLVEGLLDSLDKIDRQSLLFFRLQGATKSTKHEALMADVKHPDNAAWVRRRYLYPFIYHAVNIPNDRYLDTFLSYTVPQDAYNGVERSAIRHLLRDDLSFDRSLAFKAYIALLCHPYDVLDAFTNHFEIEVAKFGKLLPNSQNAFDKLTSVFDDTRLKGIARSKATYARSYTHGDLGQHLDMLRDNELPPRLISISLHSQCMTRKPTWQVGQSQQSGKCFFE